MNLYEYEDHSLQKLAQRLHHLSDTEVGSGFISLSSRERFPLPFSISIISLSNVHKVSSLFTRSCLLKRL